MIRIIPVVILLFFASCDSLNTRPMKLPEQLLRLSYISTLDQTERDYFVFLPRGYDDEPEKEWPVMMFLHGNGERGNGKDELDYVLGHGPLYEAWIYKKDLPFIIISPQLHMFDMDKRGIDYIDNRNRDSIPQRLEEGVPERGTPQTPQGRMNGVPEVTDMQDVPRLLPEGWDQVEEDLLGMIKTVRDKFNTDPDRLYLTGLSYGGFGTWHMANKHPEMFAAIAPVAAWGHPDLMTPIARQNLPVWVFAGGRDRTIQVEYFYAGVNKLEELGHTRLRFTTHEDLAHDVWRRVYQGDDIYDWLLEHKLSE